MKIDCKKILVVGAHPDDIEYGCYGFLLGKAKSSEIHIYVASLGSIGDPTSGQTRMRESTNALRLLEPTSMTFRQKVGIRPEDFNAVLDELTELIAKVDPDLILGLGPHDTHQEHVRIHEIIKAAARRSQASILSYGIVSNTLDFRPQFFVDISEYFNRKKMALKFHETQSAKAYMSEDYLNIFNSNTYAALHGLRYCESFEVVRFFS